MKQIKTSDQVHEELADFRDSRGHTSFDSAIRELLYIAREDDS